MSKVLAFLILLSFFISAASARDHTFCLSAGAWDARGRIERSAKARQDFKKSMPCPSTGLTAGVCPGYIIDHILPLKRGGADHPGNMQWQTKDEAKEKDKWE